MSKDQPADCDGVELYLLGDRDEDPALEAHLASCTKCQATAKAWQGAVDAYHALDEEDVAPAIAATILSLAQPKKERSAWHIAAVAAALVLITSLFALHQISKIGRSKWLEGQVAEAHALIQIGEPDKALAILEAARPQGLAPGSYPLLARLQLESGQAQAALDTLADLWDLDATAADSLDTALLTSRALGELGQRAAALTVLTEARDHFQAQAGTIDKYVEALGSGVPTEANLEDLSGLGYL